MFRYINIDYAVASTLSDDISAGIKDVVITYDIGCQWEKNLSHRLSSALSIPSLDLKSLTLGTRAQIPTGYMVKTLRSQSTFDSNMPSDQMLSTF